jgi:hypothetical protein
MNITKPHGTESIFVRDLNANDLFVVPGTNTVYLCESRQTMGANTRVVYRCSDFRGEFVKPSLSTIYLLGE